MNRRYSSRLLKFLLFFPLILNFLMAQSGKISGQVTNRDGKPLPGANIVIQNSNIGAAANIEGDFILTGVPAGTQQMTVSYIGYQKKSVEVEVEANEVVTKNINLEHKSIEGQEINVTAQALGQNQAINQQISSNTINNVVSSEQIQTLPEANAAEAVGRLPGVSLQRSGGEGSKVVIRGLSPKYTKVQVNGVTMSGTSNEDRSTDLSMISPYMLSGIELTKSISADQEGDATGGIVNFTIKEAPSEPKLNMVAQGGYNGLTNSLGTYKLTLGGSNRFFDDLLGIYAQIDAERKNASSDQLGGIWWNKPDKESPVVTRRAQIKDINRDMQRSGATLVMDYNTANTKIDGLVKSMKYISY